MIIIEVCKIFYTNFMEGDIYFHNIEAGKCLKAQNLSMHEEIG